MAEDDTARAVVVTGAGRAFSSGADLKDFGVELDERGRPDVYKALTERYHPVMHAIRELPKPVVASVNGAAAGIGCSLALCCDLIVAAQSAYLLLAFVNIGLVPDGGSSVFVPTRVGAARASEMAMLGERVPAAQALAWGLINRVAPDEQLAAETAALAQRLAAGPTHSYAGTKRLVNNWLYPRMAEQLELEAQLQREMAGYGRLRGGRDGVRGEAARAVLGQVGRPRGRVVVPPSKDRAACALPAARDQAAALEHPPNASWQTSSSAFRPRLNRIPRRLEPPRCPRPSPRC